MSAYFTNIDPIHKTAILCVHVGGWDVATFRQRALCLDPVHGTKYVQGDTVLHLLCRKKLEEFALDLLPSLGLETLKQINEEGETALWIALTKGLSEIVLALLDKGAYDETLLTQTNKCGQTALHYACMYHTMYGDVARRLLDLGADVNAKAKDLSTPLDCALCDYVPYLADYLISRGALVRA